MSNLLSDGPYLSENPLWRTNIPKSVRKGSAYCRALSSDHP